MKVRRDEFGVYLKHIDCTVRPIAPEALSTFAGEVNPYRERLQEAWSRRKPGLRITWDGSSALREGEQAKEFFSVPMAMVGVQGAEAVEVWYVWSQPLGWYDLQHRPSEGAPWRVVDHLTTPDLAAERIASLSSFWRRQGNPVGEFRVHPILHAVPRPEQPTPDK